MLLNAFVQDGVGQSEEATAGANLVRIGSSRKFFARVHLFRDGLSEFINIDAGKIELSDLLLERHPAQQVFHSAVDGLALIQIKRLLTARLTKHRKAA